MDEVRIRLANPERDGTALADIYRPYVLETALTTEIVPPDGVEFGHRIDQVLQRHPFLVAERDGQVVGYAYASAFHARAAYDWTAETSIYLSRKERGHGTGRKIYTMLEMLLREEGIVNLTACITAPIPGDNTVPPDSPPFHAALGYIPCARFEDCFMKYGRWDTVVWMQKLIGPRLSKIPPVHCWPEISAKLKEKYHLS